MFEKIHPLFSREIINNCHHITTFTFGGNFWRFICGKPISIVRHVKSTTRIKNPFIFRPLFNVGIYKTISIRFSFNNTGFDKFSWLFTISLIFSILLIFQFTTFRDLMSLFLAITTIFGVLASRFWPRFMFIVPTFLLVSPFNY